MKPALYSLLLLLLMNCNNNHDSVSNRNSNSLIQLLNSHTDILQFDLIKDSQFIPAFEEAMKINKNGINKIISNRETPTFKNTIIAFDTCGYLLNEIENIFNAFEVLDSDSIIINIAKAYDPLISEHKNKILQNDKLFERIKVVYNNRENVDYSVNENALIEKLYNKFVENGINLSETKQNNLIKINSELSSLKLEYINNLNNEYSNNYIEIFDSSELNGIPKNVIVNAEFLIENESSKVWRFYPNKQTFYTLLSFADNQELRKKIYLKYTLLANTQNENDNKKVVKKIVKLRNQKAGLFGFKNYATYIFDIDKRTIGTPEDALLIMDSIRIGLFTHLRKNIDILNKFSNKNGLKKEMKPWDLFYFKEKYNNEIILLKQDEIKPYFELENTLSGLFELINELFKVKIIENKKLPQIRGYTRSFEFFDGNKKLIGVLYSDFYSNNTFVNEIRKEFGEGNEKVNPILLSVFDFREDKDSKKILLTLKQTKDLYHEFGHILHGIMAKSPYFNLSGIDVPSDFQEFPSQFLEKYALKEDNLKRYSKHYLDGNPISIDDIKKINKYEKFNNIFRNSGILAASYIDLKWHMSENIENINVSDFEQEIREEINFPNEINSRYQSTNFTHIFTGTYAAAYYGYLWTDFLISKKLNSIKIEDIFNYRKIIEN